MYVLIIKWKHFRTTNKSVVNVVTFTVIALLS